MTNRGLAVLGIRLFSLFIALQALLSPLQPYIRVQVLDSGSVTSTSTLLGLLLCLMVAALLWVSVGRIADLVLPERRGYPAVHGEAVTIHDAQVIAYSAVGLYLVVDSLPHIAVASWPLLANHPQSYGFSDQLGLVAAGIRLMLGAALFLGGRGLAGLVHRLRRART
ncbi:MAG: hypothetical protein L0H63_13430 [Nitrococcus sp.]|nr:hypothetical protein [Nitrococcus sp.]